ncbi:MAG: hypothetical protein K6F32_03660, partial [Bacilli bacterium]|nr:hypothetical protein [Bacilli bacterium]
YVNGEFVGYSENLYLDSFFDITPFIHEGKNRVAAFVFRYSTASWMLDQDFWRMHGIFRDVSLFALPKQNAVEDIEILTDIKDFATGEADLHIALKGDFEDGLDFDYVIDHQGKMDATALTGGPSASIHFEATNLWSAEIPNIYKLKVKVSKSNKEICTVATDFGFRDVRIENKTLLFNGKKLYINGANRHEWNMERGRALLPSDDEQDVELLKKNNFNAVRTCHYPDNDRLYDLADRRGLYILDEACLETHGSWFRPDGAPSLYKGLPSNDPDLIPYCVEKVRRLYARDKNHPCVFMWSLGNESGSGKAFEEMHKELKRLNPRNIVHYEGVAWDTPDKWWISDVLSYMYTNMDDLKKFATVGRDGEGTIRDARPIVYCEYAHAMGNSCGNLDEFIKLREELPLFQGGFVWDWIDQGLLKEKDGKKMLCYGGDCGDYPNDADFNCNGVIFADRSKADKSPKLKAFKHAYQPYGIEINKEGVRITNRNLFARSDDETLFIFIQENGKLKAKQMHVLNLLPGDAQFYSYEKPIKSEGEILVQCLVMKASRGISFEGKLLQLGHAEEPSREGKCTFIKDSSASSITAGDAFYLFNRHTGAITSIECGRDKYLAAPISPTIFRPETSNDRGNGFLRRNQALTGLTLTAVPTWDQITAEKEMAKDVPSFEGGFALGNSRIDMKRTVYPDGTMKITLSTDGIKEVQELACFGLTFKLPRGFKNFIYWGKGPQESYPDRKDGLVSGEHQSNVDEEYTDYIRPQECGNHEDVRCLSIEGEESCLEFWADDTLLKFKYLPWSDFEIQNAEHREELPIPHHNYLTIAGFTRGVGGDDSWGAPVHNQYTLPANRHYEFSFYIRPKKKGQ